MQLTGRIVEEQKNYFVVDTGEATFASMRSGRLKKSRQRLCAGDVVDITVTNADSGEAIIQHRHGRSSFIARPPLANLDQVLLVSTLKAPTIEFEAIDRFLISADTYGFKPLLIFNKVDLLDATETAELQRIIGIYEAIGYETLQTSAVSGLNVDRIIQRCLGGLACVAGLSGVGKTALLRRIFPDRQLRTGALAKATGRGSHTTTATSLIKLAHGGFIADTPGFSLLELPELDEETVVSYFPELNAGQVQCRFNNCAHIDEPGCHIKELVEAGEIAESRYRSYVKFFLLSRERRREYRSSRKKAGE